MIGVATHKLSRLITKGAVTSPLRARFTRFHGSTGESEVAEEIRGGGHVGHAVGELLTCPFCMSVWIATGFCGGLVLAPRATRLTAAMLAGVTVSDFLQIAYETARQGAHTE